MVLYVLRVNKFLWEWLGDLFLRCGVVSGEGGVVSGRVISGIVNSGRVISGKGRIPIYLL